MTDDSRSTSRRVSRADERTISEPLGGAPPPPAGAEQETAGAGPAGAPGGPGQSLIGRVLGGCRIEALLGKGGMATVYRAKQLDLERDVAVKVLAPRLVRDPRQVEQFAREAKTLARLEHPNIVTVYAFGKEDETCFLVVQLVKGGTLRSMLEEKKRLGAVAATSFIQQIARGLAEAHRAGIVHRDIKPDNVLVATGPTLKLADFGLARMANDSSQPFGAGVVVGTPHYMPPEQVDGQEVDGRADIYALGATFYHLITGVTPFTATSTVDLLLKHVNEPLIPPHERFPGCPQELSKIICKMMAKERGQRYATMDDLLRDLEAPAKAAVATAPAAAQEAPPEKAAIPQALLHEALPPARYVRPAARAPRGAVWAGLGVLAVTALASVAALRPILEVVDSFGGEAETGDAVEEAAVAARARLDPQLAPLATAPRAAALRRFAAERAGTQVGVAADGEAKLLEAELERARTKELDDRLAAARALVAKGEPGPALDALAAIDAASAAGVAAPLLVTDAERARAAEVRASCQALLDARDVAWVPPGSFPAGEGTRTRAVFVGGLYVDRRETTAAQWARWVAAGGAAPASWGGPTPPPERAELPVTGVSLRQALEYARWRGRRVPTAVEWEKAARGPDGRRWPWGDEADPTRCTWGGGAPRAPGSAPRDVSPFGCLDLAGNVAELTMAPAATGAAPAAWLKGGGVGTRTFAATRAAFWQEGLGPDAGHEGVGLRLVADALPPEGN